VTDLAARRPPARRAQQQSSRVPPHDLQAEESLLGAMLLSRPAIDTAGERLRAEDFYKPAHGHVYDAILKLHNNSQPADPVTVADELRRAGLLDTIGGSATLVNLQANTPATSNAARYAQIIEDHSLLRRLIAAGGEIAEVGYQLPDDVGVALDDAESTMFAVTQRRVTDSMVPAADVMEDNLDWMEAICEHGGIPTGIPSGFHDLDELTAGFQPGALSILGARPGAGKTAWALNAASHVAIEEHRPALVFSLEMPRREIGQRLICARARIDSTRARTGKLTEKDWANIGHATGAIASAPIWIDDNPGLTIMEIRSKARRLQSRTREPLGLIVVDYLQLMTGRKSAESRQVEVAEISRGLKLLARELDCPVLALSQLSRNLESRADKRPMLSDLKESGSLEQDADVVMFIYRDEVYNPDTRDKGIAEIIIAKHRAGPTGTKKLAFLAHCTSFANLARAR
jgi:replicative DNA helicase